MNEVPDLVVPFSTGDARLGPLLASCPAAEWVARLGAKGYQVAKMAAAGVPVPEGFVLTTRATGEFFREHARLLLSVPADGALLPDLVDSCTLPPPVEDALGRALDALQEATGRTLASAARPLVVSVRTGATVSMPGILDTLCNVGLPPVPEGGPAPFWMVDSSCKFLEDWGVLVAGLERPRLEELRRRFEGSGPLALGARLDALRGRVPLPGDPREQVRRAVRALLVRSRGERAAEYRRIHYLAEDLQVGIVVQRMVFGNFNERSGAGVVFTRDPSTGLAEVAKDGSRRLLGQFRTGGQGSDVVNDLGEVEPLGRMEEEFPEAARRLQEVFLRLEKEEKSVQDGEFTIEDGVLWVLQTRPAKMSPQGTLQAAVDLVGEGVIREEDAIRLMGSRPLERLLFANDQALDASGLERVGQGRTLVPGVAAGHLVFTAQAIEKFKSRNESAILCRENLRNEDVRLMDLVDGLLSRQRNQTSHATLVARATGHPALIEASLEVDVAARTAAFTNRNLDRVVLPEGAYVTLDATRGAIYRGRAVLQGGDLSDPGLRTFLGYLNRRPTLKVFTQAEDEDSYRTAVSLGADGLGYFRSDVIFFQREVNFALCALLLAPDGEQEARGRELADRLVGPYVELLRFGGPEIGIRLIKHSMPEFFPTAVYEIRMLAEWLLRRAGRDPDDPKALEAQVQEIRDRRRRLKDYNPIVGLRGARLATVFPAVFEAQARALFRAMREARARGFRGAVDLFVPYLTLVQEFLAVRDLLARAAREELGGEPAAWRAVPVIEVSGIALEAGELARHADRIVIRTDRLTTSTHHLVREDSHAFLGEYVQRGWFYGDPFRIIQKSTEMLVAAAIDAARKVNPSIRIMVAGDHCGNEYSLRRLLHLGITEVCCPPRMVPIVKLIAQNLEMAGLRPPACAPTGENGK